MVLEWDTLVSRYVLGYLAIEGEEASRRLLFDVWNSQIDLIGEVWIKSPRVVEAVGLTLCYTVVLEDRGGKWHPQEDRPCPRSLSMFLCFGGRK